MKGRCHNPKHSNYYKYGARGIEVCNEWRCSYEVFRGWALLNGYGPGLQLDRKDNNQGYSPSNCQFISNAKNSRNRRSTKLDDLKVEEIRIKHSSGRITLERIAMEYGVSTGYIWKIVNNLKWIK
jgi:hypothetical protein